MQTPIANTPRELMPMPTAKARNQDSVDGPLALFPVTTLRHRQKLLPEMKYEVRRGKSINKKILEDRDKMY